MAIPPPVPQPSSEREIVLTRLFRAPRDQIWQAWTEPHHVAHWWGPAGFITNVEELDLQPGGTWHYIMMGPDGSRYPTRGVFQEVRPPARIVTTAELVSDGNPAQGTHRLQGMVLTVTFEAWGHSTQLTLRIDHPTGGDRCQPAAMDIIGGWHSSLNCLAEYLEWMLSSHPHRR